MNLPVGENITRGLNLKEIDVRRLIEGLFEKGFSGYIVSTLEGFDGIEEGVLIFREGVLAASLYEYDLHDITVFGDSAVAQVFNSFAAEYVVADLIMLTEQQVDLVTAFNDKSKLQRPVSKNDVARLLPKVFSQQFAKDVLKHVQGDEESKSDVFKKLGLSGLGD